MFLKEESNLSRGILKNLNESEINEADKYIPGRGDVLITPEQAEEYFKYISDTYGPHNQIIIRGAGPEAKYQGEYWSDFTNKYPQFRDAKFNGKSYRLSANSKHTESHKNESWEDICPQAFDNDQEDFYDIIVRGVNPQTALECLRDYFEFGGFEGEYEGDPNNAEEAIKWGETLERDSLGFLYGEIEKKCTPEEHEAIANELRHDEEDFEEE